MNTERTWCGTATDHVGHLVDGGSWRCQGRGRFHDDMMPVALSIRRCTTTWTGPTGLIWDCIALEHASHPGGYVGTGHVMRARPRAA